MYTVGNFKLGLLIHFLWPMQPVDEQTLVTSESSIDEDPFDEIASSDAPNLGIIVRTDYTNEDAWTAFYTTLVEAEKEFLADTDVPVPETSANSDASTSAVPAGGGETEDTEMADGGADEEEEAEEPLAFFAVLDAQESAEQSRLTGLSNLGALRLVNDVDVRRAPPVPEGTKRVSPGNRLVDLDGYQEVYKGKTVWVYDAKSNADQSVRLVSQQADMYGTAT